MAEHWLQRRGARDAPESTTWPFPTWFRWPSPRELFDMLPSETPMRIDEDIEDGHLVIRAEMPGIDPERDVDIRVQDNTLTIRAERRREDKQEHRGALRREIHYGTFVRNIALPEGADADDITANYKDGVLEVRLPYAESGSTGRKVPIERG